MDQPGGVGRAESSHWLRVVSRRWGNAHCPGLARKKRTLPLLPGRVELGCIHFSSGAGKLLYR